MFTVKQLRYFQTLANIGHFGEASDKLGISQPALSAQIAEMEKMAGSALFERTAKRIILTPLGLSFLPYVNDILGRMSALGDIIASHKVPLSHPLKLGIIPTVAPYLLPSLLPRIRYLYPSLSLQIKESKTDRVVVWTPLLQRRPLTKMSSCVSRFLTIIFIMLSPEMIPMLYIKA